MVDICIGTAVDDQFDAEICESVDHTVQCCDTRQPDVELVSLCPVAGSSTLLDVGLIAGERFIRTRT